MERRGREATAGQSEAAPFWKAASGDQLGRAAGAVEYFKRRYEHHRLRPSRFLPSLLYGRGKNAPSGKAGADGAGSGQRQKFYRLGQTDGKGCGICKNLSFAMDVKVLWLTVKTVLGHSDEVAEDTNAVEGNFAKIRQKRLEETGSLKKPEQEVLRKS